MFLQNWGPQNYGIPDWIGWCNRINDDGMMLDDWIGFCKDDDGGPFGRVSNFTNHPYMGWSEPKLVVCHIITYNSKNISMLWQIRE